MQMFTIVIVHCTLYSVHIYFTIIKVPLYKSKIKWMLRTLKQIVSMSGLFVIWFQTLVCIEDIADHKDNKLFFMTYKFR